MAHHVLLEINAKAGEADNILGALRAILPDTRAYHGFVSITTLQNQTDPNTMVLHEVWDSKAQYEAYLSWRTETGVMGQLAEMLAAPPSIRHFGQSPV